MTAALRYLSVCSGIEAASVAWKPLGFECAAMSEIAAFPRSVLQHHYPRVPLRGDFTEIEENDHGTIDVLVGGTPCQSFSINGLRGGLADDRGNLALEFLRLAARKRPRWLLWENVPGVLSSWSDDPDHPPQEEITPGIGDDGERWLCPTGFEIVRQRNDFDCFLSGMAELGYGFAWRILDAQYIRVQSHAFAVPQRRRRVFVVGYLGDWRPPASVLFERESLRGHSAPRRETGAYIANALGTGFESRGGPSGMIDAAQGNHLLPICEDVAKTMQSSDGGVGNDYHSVVAEPLTTSPYADRPGAESQLIPQVADPISSREQSTYSHEGKHMRLHNCIPYPANDTAVPETSLCLNAGGMGRIDLETETLLACFDETQITDAEPRSTARPDSRNTLPNNERPPTIAFEPRHRGDDGRGYDRPPSFSEEVGPTLNGVKQPAIAECHVPTRVRRLTPVECERLQGFPDNYTLVQHRGKPAKDGPRYKALGNSMAVNVMRWLGERLQEVHGRVIQ